MGMWNYVLIFNQFYDQCLCFCANTMCVYTYSYEIQLETWDGHTSTRSLILQEFQECISFPVNVCMCVCACARVHTGVHSYELEDFFHFL